jgi:alpha-methylacyl-CoA racemase
MLLADMGAEIIRIDRVTGSAMPIESDPRLDVSARGRRSLAFDLKHPAAVAAVLKLCRHMDGLIESFRPGVMERLGLGPDDIRHENYLALSGCLHMLGRGDEKPVPPLNLVADMGGGGLLLAFGMACAFLERQHSGKGQTIDAAMTEGAALLATSVYALRGAGWWRDERGANLLDTGAPFYEVYETQDRKYLAVGAIEPQFYAALLAGMGLDPDSLPAQMDRARWPEMKRLFADVLRKKTRAQWTAIFAGTDACVTPVLSPTEAAEHAHSRAEHPATAARGTHR